MKAQDWAVLLLLAGFTFYAEARWIKLGTRF